VAKNGERILKGKYDNKSNVFSIFIPKQWPAGMTRSTLFILNVHDFRVLFFGKKIGVGRVESIMSILPEGAISIKDAFIIFSPGKGVNLL